MDGGALCVALRASGANLPGGRLACADDRVALLLPLMKRGLVLNADSGNPAYLSNYGSNNVFTDERLLAASGPLVVTPFALKPITPADGTLYRRPQAIALDLIGLLQAVENQGGIGLTQNGPPRVNDLRRIGKAMGWSEDTTPVDGLPFPNLTVGLIHVAAARGRAEGSRWAADPGRAGQRLRRVALMSNRLGCCSTVLHRPAHGMNVGHRSAIST